jgi:hypothetical protein
MSNDALTTQLLEMDRQQASQSLCSGELPPL